MWSHFYVGQLLLGLEPDLEYGLHTSRTPLDNSDFFFLSQQLSIEKKKLLSYGKTLDLLLIFCLRNLYGFSLCRFCVHPQSLS